MCIFKKVKYRCGCEALTGKPVLVGGTCERRLYGFACVQHYLEPPLVLNYGCYYHRLEPNHGGLPA